IPVFYAHQDIKTPVRIGIACICKGLVLKLILMWPLKHAGIALATVIATFVEVIVLFVLIHRRFGSPGWDNILFSFLKVFSAAVAMGLVAVITKNASESLFVSHGMPLQVTRLLSLMAAIGLAILTYVLTAFILRCQELKEFWSAFRHKAEQAV
ncbi:MAG: lipid II flippase MurJ, partial [Kiritimatiellia bacterium]|nr:lipid II flippase MurJ [Kiritimatiellia bacterium]